MTRIESPDGISFDPVERRIGKRRWMGYSLVALFSMIIAYTVGQWLPFPSRQRPEPIVFALVEIDRSPTFFASGQPDPSETETRRFLESQVALVRSPDVLQSVFLLSPSISNSPEIQSLVSPEEWLADVIQVELIKDTSLILISAKDAAIPLQIELINAIAKTYTKMANQAFVQEYQSLATMEKSLRESLRKARNRLKDEMAKDPHSVEVEELKDTIAVDQQLWKRLASVMRTSQSGGRFQVRLLQQASYPKTL